MSSFSFWSRVPFFSDAFWAGMFWASDAPPWIFSEAFGIQHIWGCFTLFIQWHRILYNTAPCFVKDFFKIFLFFSIVIYTAKIKENGNFLRNPYTKRTFQQPTPATRLAEKEKIFVENIMKFPNFLKKPTVSSKITLHFHNVFLACEREHLYN